MYQKISNIHSSKYMYLKKYQKELKKGVLGIYIG